MGKKVDLTGKVFGSWTVLSDSGERSGGFVVWTCQCVCGRVVNVNGGNLRRGLSISCGKCAPVCGVGSNDLDASNSCPVYQVWKRILERTVSLTKNEVYPTYADTTIAKDWLKLSNFKAWMVEQNWLGLEIDKDLLVKGNSHYGPETCWFVPSRINLILGTSDAKRGEYPIGVTKHNDGINRFLARCCSKYLGLYRTPEDAHFAWQRAKSSSIVEAIYWWQFEPSVSHSFNQTIAENLFGLAESLLEDSKRGTETVSLKI